MVNTTTWTAPPSAYSKTTDASRPRVQFFVKMVSPQGFEPWTY